MVTRTRVYQPLPCLCNTQPACNPQPLAGNVTRKYGRLPAQFPGQLRTLSHYVAGALPAPPPSVRVPGEHYAWGMLGNDTYGDCGVAGLEHGLEAQALVAHGIVNAPPSATQAVDYYLAYTGGQDTGVVLSDFLNYTRQHGYYGEKVSAYAPVNHTSVTEMRQAIALFDFAYTGIRVTARMEDEYAAGQDWTLESLNSETVGLHCVPATAYGSHRATVITWGKLQPVAWAAYVAMMDEAWVVLTGELSQGDGRGINYTQLQADLNQLT